LGMPRFFYWRWEMPFASGHRHSNQAPHFADHVAEKKSGPEIQPDAGPPMAIMRPRNAFNPANAR
jgi:hypothetical protein